MNRTPHRILASAVLAALLPLLAAAPHARAEGAPPLPRVATATQPRVLFDNAHAETAGNADWIIDTDQPVPVPDQSTVTPATPRTYWLGATSSWGIDLVKRGFYVATNTAPLAYGGAGAYDLSQWDVLVVCEPNTKFTAGESAAILQFIADGGGLVAVVDHDNSDRNGDGFDSPKIWNALDPTQLLGIHSQSTGETNNNITQDSGNEETSPADSVTHGPYGVADSLSFHNGTTFVLNPAANPRVRGLFWMNGLAHGNTGVMAARSEYGSGRVVFVGDSSPADDGSAQPGNSSIFDGWGEAAGRDSILVLNATRWVARRYETVGSPLGGLERGGLALAAPAPNPSRDAVVLRFALPHATRARLEVWDVAGRRVRVIGDGDSPAGEHAATWDGRDAAGGLAPAGVYLARLVTPEGDVARRFVRVR